MGGEGWWLGKEEMFCACCARRNDLDAKIFGGIEGARGGDGFEEEFVVLGVVAEDLIGLGVVGEGDGELDPAAEGEPVFCGEFALDVEGAALGFFGE